MQMIPWLSPFPLMWFFLSPSVWVTLLKTSIPFCLVSLPSIWLPSAMDTLTGDGLFLPDFQQYFPKLVSHWNDSSSTGRLYKLVKSQNIHQLWMLFMAHKPMLSRSETHTGVVPFACWHVLLEKSRVRSWFDPIFPPFWWISILSAVLKNNPWWFIPNFQVQTLSLQQNLLSPVW